MYIYVLYIYIYLSIYIYIFIYIYIYITWKVDAPLWWGAISNESVPSAEISGIRANNPASPPGSCTSENDSTWLRFRV